MVANADEEQAEGEDREQETPSVAAPASKRKRAIHPKKTKKKIIPVFRDQELQSASSGSEDDNDVEMDSPSSSSG